MRAGFVPVALALAVYGQPPRAEMTGFPQQDIYQTCLVWSAAPGEMGMSFPACYGEQSLARDMLVALWQQDPPPERLAECAGSATYSLIISCLGYALPWPTLDEIQAAQDSRQQEFVDSLTEDNDAD